MTRVLMVEARFYPHISDALYDGAANALDIGGVMSDRITVPGALEIPAAIKAAAKFYDGFVALGCVIRGETYHFEIVAMQSARALMDLTIFDGLAIGNGILTVDTEAQALRRADRTLLDKGGDAARACIAMMEVQQRFASVAAVKSGR
jgi:6,7-dimethyl-8-ribityllumazine synthase